MNNRDKEKRHKAITDAAYALLAEYGYSGTSMLRVAKAANASNETLYRWYGNKLGLFVRMVEDNAAETKSLLEDALARQEDPKRTLEAVSPVLLTMLLGDKAVLLNRAAAADPTGELGSAISVGGRQRILPLLEELICKISPTRQKPASEAAIWFVSLLVGDQLIRRIIHHSPPPDEREITLRCDLALEAFYTLLDETD